MAEYDLDLAKSLEEIGQIYDIICASDGEILDGYHRDKELKKLGEESRTRLLEWCRTKEDKLKVRRHLNMARRILSAKEKRQYINDRAEQLVKEGIKPLEVIPKLIEEGFSKTTIYRYIHNIYKTETKPKKDSHSGNNIVLIPQPGEFLSFFAGAPIWAKVYKKLGKRLFKEFIKTIEDHCKEIKLDKHKALTKSDISDLLEVVYAKLEETNFPKLDDQSMLLWKFLAEEYNKRYKDAALERE